MYLKQIELSGFKSFADRTVITPEQGISCIVGPNGSGKSNISDAVRWVLGEQSARNLRGGSISDVIFSGSKGRKALGMAEVQLTLDNSDGHLPLPHAEVTVCRRNYRSGQSDYLINGSSCRLKDIHSLFLDSGVGLDGISIISQGQISELMSAKPDERRVLVEEAAGIIKFRNRKRDALRKLDDTQHNLERLQDIIGELEQRLEPLRKESEAAAAYLELKEKADYYEINLSSIFLRELTEKLQTANAQLKVGQDDMLQTETQRLSLEAKSLRKQEELRGLDEGLQATQRAFYELNNRLEQQTGAKQVLLTQKEHNVQDGQKLEAELKAQEALLRNAEEASLSLAAQLASLHEELEAAASNLAEHSGSERQLKEHLAFLEQEVEALKNDSFDNAAALASLRNKLHYQEQMRAQALAKQQRLTEQVCKLDEFALQQQAAQLKAEQELNEQRELKEQLKTKKLALQAEDAKQLGIISEIAAKETAVRFDLNSLEARYNTMKEMQDNMEGFFPGVRAVLRAAKAHEQGLEGVLDAFASLVRVPAEYNTAIETYLGAALQDIVCRNEAAAKAGIAYLKRTEGGRATFLPLSSLRPKRAEAGAMLKIKGVHGIASDLIDYPADIAKAAEFLLGRVIIAENVGCAAAAAKVADYRFAVVTLDGDLINPGGSMTGGSRAKRNNDILTQKSNLENMRLRLGQLQHEHSERAAELSKARAEGERINALLDGIAAKAAGNNERLAELQSTLTGIEQAAGIAARQLAAAKDELNEVLQSLADFDTEEAETKQQAEELLIKEAQLNELLLAKQAEQTEMQFKCDASQEDLSQYRVELARKQELCGSLQKETARNEQEQTDIAWEIEQRREQKQRQEQELVKLEQSLEQGNQTLLELERSLAEAELELAERRYGLSAESEEQRQLEAQIKQLSALATEKQKTLYDLQIKQARMEADRENEEAKLRERFDKSYADIAALPPCELGKKELREQLSSHRRAIAALGNVNLNSIEQYQEVSERYTFLSRQKEDLCSAKETLSKVIGEMDSIMTARFKEAYTALSEQFNLSFSRLFNGGNATLVLTQPDNLLETGVELEVNIPGKRLSNYTLLSGGEKSLIGLSLMFAILAVRPTPFCIMDEVDAALDEANVERFAAYLQDLSSKTQFIMISHRQGTMEAASCLYGVTMQSSGVSKLISVRLGELKQTE